MQITLRQIANLLALIAVIIMNYLANALPLNGLTTGEIANRFAVYFKPAGYAFAIWGLIYLGLLGFAVYQVRPSQGNRAYLGQIGYLFVLSSVANVAWLFLWHYLQFPLTVIAMLAILITLILIYIRLDIGRAAVSTADRWLVHAPFSIYLGWITVATIANITILLEYWQWGGLGISPQVWAVILILVALGLAATVLFKRGDVLYVLVIVWALIAIAVEQSGAPLVAWSSGISAVLLLILLLGNRRIWSGG